VILVYLRGKITQSGEPRINTDFTEKNKRAAGPQIVNLLGGRRRWLQSSILNIVNRQGAKAAKTGEEEGIHRLHRFSEEGMRKTGTEQSFTKSW